MSILIKGMKMPNNCGACPLRLAWCRERIYMVKRPERCPLVPVPPHGGLIDKRKVVQTVYDYCHTVDGKYCGPDDVGELWDEMKAMPAIIPASEEGV